MRQALARQRSAAALAASLPLAVGLTPPPATAAAAPAAAPPAAAPPAAAGVADRGPQRDRRGPGHHPTAEQRARHARDKAADPGRAQHPATARTVATEGGAGRGTAVRLARTTPGGPITSSGPLTSITASPDLNCSVRHAGDSAVEFYGDTAGGTFLAVGGVLFGPANVPAGGGASPRTAWTPVSRTGPTWRP